MHTTTAVTRWYKDSPVESIRETVTSDEVSALNCAVAQIRGDKQEWPLISLLRKLDPESPVLAQMDEIARQTGWVRAGSDEILPGYEHPDRGNIPTDPSPR